MKALLLLLLLLSLRLISTVMKKKKSRHVTADLTGRDLIQIKNRAALCKHSITHGMTKLVEHDDRGAGLLLII